MNQPIRVLHAGSGPACGLGAEVLRCEGFPWLEEARVEEFDAAPPGVELLVVAGAGVSRRAAERLAKAVAQGMSLVALTPDPELAAAFGVAIGEPVVDAHLSVTGLPGWEHGDVPLLCPDDVAHPLDGEKEVAALRDFEDRRCGAGIISVRPGKGCAWLYGYDLCETIAMLRYGTGRLDPPEDISWKGPRVINSFLELSGKLPHDVPVADLHQDVLRSIVTGALADTSLPRLWHFPEGAPAVWMVRGDGCGEEGADFEVAVVEKYGGFLTFCRPPKSRYSGALMREWHDRGHGITIEANINEITQPVVEDGSGNRTVAELNADWLPAIRANLEGHRDGFMRETGLEMETFMTHSAQWTGLPMAKMVRELGWRTAIPFMSYDPRILPGDRKGPYMISTALPMRYFDREAGVLDLWHLPYQNIDTIWQGIGKQPLPAEADTADPDARYRMLGQTGEAYGTQLARFAEDAATRWHGVQVSSFHPRYVASPRPHVGSSQQALEIAMEGARAAGCRFENLERWSRFFRARAGVRLKEWWTEGSTIFVTLESNSGMEGLTLLLPDRVKEVRLKERGDVLPVRQLTLEGRTQNAVVVDLGEGAPLRLCLKKA